MTLFQSHGGRGVKTPGFIVFVIKRFGLSETLYYMAYRKRRQYGQSRRRSKWRSVKKGKSYGKSGRRIKSYTVSRGGVRM